MTVAEDTRQHGIVQIGGSDLGCTNAFQAKGSALVLFTARGAVADNQHAAFQADYEGLLPGQFFVRRFFVGRR